jgi:tRNA pseudouridine55 synthase
MNGLILIDKGEGCTSHDVVLSVRKLTAQKKAGHFGTLDPQATGLLIIALGKATRFFPYYLKSDKHYTGTIRLGFSTDTYDADGSPTSEKSDDFPTEAALTEAIRPFIGSILQAPPPYSAKKYKGKPLYSLARRNKPVPLIPAEVTVFSWRISDYNPPLFQFDIRCASGTYIRSLAHDIGQVFGCGAHLSSLRRHRIGTFNVADALSLEKLKSLLDGGDRSSFLHPMENLLAELPTVIINPAGIILAGNGNPISSEYVLSMHSGAHEESGTDDTISYRLFSEDNRFIALSRRDEKNDCFHPFLVLENGGA